MIMVGVAVFSLPLLSYFLIILHMLSAAYRFLDFKIKYNLNNINLDERSFLSMVRDYLSRLDFSEKGK